MKKLLLFVFLAFSIYGCAKTNSESQPTTSVTNNPVTKTLEEIESKFVGTYNLTELYIDSVLTEIEYEYNKIEILINGTYKSENKINEVVTSLTGTVMIDDNNIYFTSVFDGHEATEVYKINDNKIEFNTNIGDSVIKLVFTKGA